VDAGFRKIMLNQRIQGAMGFNLIPSRSRMAAGHINWLPRPRETSMLEFKELSRSVKGLTVLVTGAASGMGRATARVFAAEGANVAVTDVSADGVKGVVDEITASGGTAKAWTLDVSDRDAIGRVIPEMAAHFGGLDIIVNNAGILRARADR
jgi:NADPH:quinone reductase-like Zn-dependent oxidoreductase